MANQRNQTMRYIFTFFFLLIGGGCSQVPFQVFNLTYQHPSIMFYAKTGDVVTIMVQFDQPFMGYQLKLISSFFKNIEYDLTRDLQAQLIPKQATQSQILEVNIMGENMYCAMLKISSNSKTDIIYSKMTILINNKKIREHYQAFKISEINSLTLVSTFSTTKVCKVNILLNSYYIPRIFEVISSSNKAILKKEYPNTFYYPNLYLNQTGKWKIMLTFSKSEVKFISRIQLNITTFIDEKCINQCTDLNEKQVVGLVYYPPTQNICLCDETIPGYVWDKINKKCKVVKTDTSQIKCNSNNILDQGQQCDNGDKEGCKNCLVQKDYICSQVPLQASICQQYNNLTSNSIFIVYIVSSLILVCFILIICIIKKKQESRITQQKKQQWKDFIQGFKNYRNFRIKKAIKEGKMKEKNPELLNPSIPCGICLKSDCTIALAGCFHYFHGQCILEWLRTDKECPVCKKSYLQGLSSVENIKEQL